MGDHAVGQLWELLPFYQRKWRAQECTLIVIKQIGSTDVWNCLCVETSRVLAVPLSSTIYQRVI